MNLVGFKAQNHPQQVLIRGPRVNVDERATPPEYFATLHERFRFTVDVAAFPHNAKLERYFTPEQDGLEQSWEGERVWCNPPYSTIEPWVIKAHDARAELVVMLLPANRTEQGWWQRQVEPRRDRGGGHYASSFSPADCGSWPPARSGSARTSVHRSAAACSSGRKAREARARTLAITPHPYTDRPLWRPGHTRPGRPLLHHRPDAG